MEEMTKKELRDERREMRKKEEVVKVKSRRIKKIIVGVIVTVLLLLVGWTLYDGTKPSRTLGEDRSRAIALQEASHIKIEDQHPAYNSNPPTSGPHWADPVRPGVFDKSQPDEGVVHSLEHGMIWISYTSSIPDMAKEVLRKITRGHAGIVLTVRDANDADIALAGWGRLDTFTVNQDGSVDEGRILDFIARYYDKGPEKLPFMSGKEY